MRLDKKTIENIERHIKDGYIKTRKHHEIFKEEI